MKPSIGILFIFVGLLSIQCSSSHTSAVAHGWEKLGERKVNYGLDRDEILVTARDGRFNKIKLAVKHAPLNMHRCIVHFGNGEKQDVSIRNTIRRGGETRVIDLKGGQRVIRKVVFWYDTKNASKRRATIQLWGRH